MKNLGKSVLRDGPGFSIKIISNNIYNFWKNDGCLYYSNDVDEIVSRLWVDNSNRIFNMILTRDMLMEKK